MNPLPRLFLSKFGVHGDKYKACRYQKQVEFSINPSHFARVNVAHGCSWKFFLGEGSTFCSQNERGYHLTVKLISTRVLFGFLEYKNTKYLSTEVANLLTLET